jgi:hypothetical protein
VTRGRIPHPTATLLGLGLSAYSSDFSGGTGEWLVVLPVVSTAGLCGAKPNSLTPLGSVVLPLLKITTHYVAHLACCFMH